MHTHSSPRNLRLSLRARRPFYLASLATALVFVFMAGNASAQRAVAGYQCVTLRSGANQGITFSATTTHAVPLSNAPFTPFDFSTACNGAPAQLVAQPHPNWIQSLPSDSLAQWISVDTFRTPRSTLFCQSFEVSACTLQGATLQLWFAADDQLGDPANGANPIGVYLNGQPVAGFSGGNYVAETFWFHNNIGPLLVPGTNRLQIYQRDTNASVGGVIYSARICYMPCLPTELIRLRSGNGALGGPDNQITQYAGLAATPIKPTLLTPGTDPLFTAAASGPPAEVVFGFPRHWCTPLAADPLAQWIASDQNLTGRSIIFSQPFQVATCAIQSASLHIDFHVDDALGDLGAPGNVGLYLNGQPVPGSIANGVDGGLCGSFFSANVTGLVTNGLNRLQIYVSDDDTFRAGILYSAQLSIVACGGPETIVMRSSPNQNIRAWSGVSSTPLNNAPFNAVNFAAADAGPLALTGPLIPGWCPTLPCDPLAQWMSITNDRQPRSALYAHPFTVTSCPNNISRVKLEICFCADNSLGDPPSAGGPNQSGLYLNGHSVPMGSAFGNFITSTSFSATIPSAWIHTGANTLYVYNRDLSGGYSGVIYSAKLTIQPCTPYALYGEGCGSPTPTMAMSGNPEIGGQSEMRIATGHRFAPVFTILGISDSFWAGIALPLDLTPFGATGCLLLASLDLQLPLLITDALGEANLTLPVPNDVLLVDLALYFQAFLIDPGANPLGLVTSPGHAVFVQWPSL